MKEKEQKQKAEKGRSETSTSSAEDAEREKTIAGTGCHDKKCHIHGNLKLRGKTFEGKIIRKFPKRIAIEFERMVYVKKYERYKKSRTKIHARLPDCMAEKINVGDFVKIRECRPLSKLIHFAVISKVKGDGK